MSAVVRVNATSYDFVCPASVNSSVFGVTSAVTPARPCTLAV
ncbi:hypothetical protein BC477_04050 [Clavibacter michiganensis subsp. michiganensis]|uniref:Uncharacterized protein n=1 Tax=Clavibacter michiganensis subsp. michiganensis TaxID=33013 RepID=A0A251XK53_CLAMM|nr:hypothetical protein BC477_04050 [Clavibacter michiganensis subsp. michiganensis]OUE03884.1 hypothetical protein CMMCAS07_02985 [Clavibacter michiganensis subsp. michiganensis]